MRPTGEDVAVSNLRPFAAGTLLFVATVAFVLFQNAHVAMLWDLSYLLDSSDRIALGQVPYRDFPFAHAPLTFLLQAASIRLFGRVYWHVIAYAALTGATATLLTWRILVRLLDVTNQSNHPTSVVPPEAQRRGETCSPAAGFSPRKPHLLAFLLALPLVFLSITSIYPHPIYDNDCIFAILFALYCLQRSSTATPVRNLLTGAVLICPLFIKQNIGLLFLAAAMAGLAAMAFQKRLRQQSTRAESLVAAGGVLTLLAALLVIHQTAGLGNYYHWTMAFAAQQRLPSFGSMLGVYRQPQLLWSLPCSLAGFLLLHSRPRMWRGMAWLLLAAPFLFTAASLCWLDDASDRTDQLLTLWPHLLILSAALLLYDLWRRRFTFVALLPLILLAAIHGTFLSQQLWGSNYALWPLLMLLIACLLKRVPAIATPLAATLCVVLIVNGSLYALSHERLSYSQLTGPAARSSLPALRGLSTRGPWLPAFGELVADTYHTIPPGDVLLLFPGQDPFYYATGRTPQFPVLLFDVATNPYTPQQLAAAVTERKVRWLIVNRNLQLSQPPLVNYDDYLQALVPLFIHDHKINDYDIYRRR